MSKKMAKMKLCKRNRSQAFRVVKQKDIFGGIDAKGTVFNLKRGELGQQGESSKIQ